MGIIRHSDGVVDSPMPGMHRVTIVHKGTGAGALTTREVTLEPGVRMTPHWHRIEESMMVVEGEGTCILGDEELPIKAGETLLGPAGIPHGFINTGSTRMKLIVAFPGIEVETFTK